MVTAPDGESGLVELEARGFDVAMLDLGLPGISGLDVAARLKESWPATRLALMTGYGDRVGPGHKHDSGCAVGSWAAGVRVWYLTVTGTRPKHGATAAGGRSCCLSSLPQASRMR